MKKTNKTSLAQSVDGWAEVVLAMTAFRHRLHRDPEIAFDEHRTAASIATQLDALPGMQVVRGVGGTGVVGILGADRRGPCVALRADMDALPICEVSEKPYASCRVGVMHACGHDGHMACLLGAAQWLARDPDRLCGPVKFFFQPAEEAGGGALRLCEAGVLDRPRVDAVFALHGCPNLPLGVVGMRSGVAFASTDALDITIHGAGTHAASPHQGIDPILAAAHVVTALQSIVSRNISPTDALVITIGQIEGGSVRNVIPPSVSLYGTVRALSSTVRRDALKRIRTVVRQTAAALGATADVKVEPGYPLLRNDARAVAFLSGTARECPGVLDVRTSIEPTLGGEDFAYFAQRRPAVMARLGLQAPEALPMPSLHHPSFDFSDAAIPLGIRLLCAIAHRFDRFAAASVDAAATTRQSAPRRRRD